MQARCDHCRQSVGAVLPTSRAVCTRAARRSPVRALLYIVLVLVALWACGLSGYLSWRNWGKPEDHRYQEIRRRNEPGFAFKSLYLVFGVQAVLAWIIAAPLLAGIASQTPLGLLDYVGIALWMVRLPV